jgi:hypothetical protein
MGLPVDVRAGSMRVWCVLEAGTDWSIHPIISGPVCCLTSSYIKTGMINPTENNTPYTSTSLPVPARVWLSLLPFS